MALAAPDLLPLDTACPGTRWLPLKEEAHSAILADGVEPNDAFPASFQDCVQQYSRHDTAHWSIKLQHSLAARFHRIEEAKLLQNVKAQSETEFNVLQIRLRCTGGSFIGHWITGSFATIRSAMEIMCSVLISSGSSDHQTGTSMPSLSCSFVSG